MSVAGISIPQQAHAAGNPNLVGACSGVSLPPSVVTGIMGPVVSGVVAPLQTILNAALSLAGLSIDPTTLLTNAAAGDPISLNVLTNGGQVVGAGACALASDSYSLNTDAGLSIGGNQITGLGATGLTASAGEIGSIAFGNSAHTDAGAINAVALGSNAQVLTPVIGATGTGSVALGASSLAQRGALTDYTAFGLAALQTSAGEVSVGSAGAERQITNVAAGLLPTDAVNVAQLTGFADSLGTLSGLAVQYDDAAQGVITLGGTAGTTIANVAPGILAADSTDAVNGGQLFATNTNVTNLINGALGPVQYSSVAFPTTANGGTPTNELTLIGGTLGPVGLHNVRDGVIGLGSTDAVNGGQFNALGTGIAGAFGGTSTYDPVTNTLSTNLAYDGTQYNTVQDVLTALDGDINSGTGTRYFRVNSIGPDAVAIGLDSVAIGPEALALAGNSVALGAGSTATRGAIGGVGYGAFGLGTPQFSAGEVSVGSVGAERQITNVAAGAALTDAVNLAQLEGVASSLGALGDQAVQYDDASKAIVTLGGVTGTTITNVAPGILAADSTDAVNGGQLFATNTNVTNLINGALGPVQYSSIGSPTTPNGGIATNELTLVGGTLGTVGLHNVRAGAIGIGSTDAINGEQFGSLGTGIAGMFGGTSTYDPVTNTFSTSLVYDGTEYGNVQDVLTALDGEVNSGTGTRYFRVNSTGADALASGADSIAIGPEAVASADNSVALGAGSLALRGALGGAGYTAFGLDGAQFSAGEVSVGFAGGERQITNVAAGSAPTDAVNVAQLEGVANQAAAASANSFQYDGADKSSITLGGTGGTTITNVKAGDVSATSTDAVNGAQLYDTNQAVANNTTAIDNLTNNVSNGSVGPVQYSNPDSGTTPNGGTKTNDLTLVGGNAGAVTLHNVGNGSISAGSTDAVNGGQIYALAASAVNAVTYDTDENGNRTNTITLAGGDASAPVTMRNVAAGSVAAGSTEAVNGGQLFTTNQAVATAQTTANTALVLGQNSVQYDNAAHNSVTLGSTGAGGNTGPVSLHNVAAGVADNDAVNVAQLNTGINGALTQANAYTDQRVAAINFDLKRVQRNANAGTAGALAAAGLPQSYEAGKGMVAIAGGTYQGQSAVAIGLSKAFSDGHTVVKLDAAYDTRGRAGGSAGIGYQF